MTRPLAGGSITSPCTRFWNIQADGMSSRTEDAAFRQIEAAGGVTTSVVTLVTALAPNSSADLGPSRWRCAWWRPRTETWP